MWVKRREEVRRLSSSKKKRVQPKGEQRQVETQVKETAAEQSFSAWPDTFASPRKSVAISLGVLVWLALVGVLAGFGYLESVKVFVAWFLGLSNPMDVAGGNWDIAAVLMGLGLVVGGGLVHPGIGLGVLLLVRSFLDGYTYPTDNFYFAWGGMLLFVLWGVRVLLRGEQVKVGAAGILLGALVLLGAFTMVGTVQFNTTYRQVLLWFSYLLVFVLTLNIVQRRGVYMPLMVLFFIGFLAQAVFALLHFYYLLPFLRHMLMNSTEMRLQYFGVSEFSPEMIQRFNVNRAFGSMLYPNTLAGFLILGIPFASVEAWRGWGVLRAQWGRRVADTDSNRYRAVAVAAVTWLVTTLVLFIMVQFPHVYQIEPLPGWASLYNLAGLSAVLACIPGALLFWVAKGRGAYVAGVVVWAVGLTVGTLAACWALWLTYSRGGMLAFGVAVIAGAVLYVYATGHGPRLRGGLRATGTAVLVAVLLGGAVWSLQTPFMTAQTSLANAQEAEGEREGEVVQQRRPASHEQLMEEGSEVTLENLMDPASLSLRFTYWAVGLRMFWHHFFTGVGWGNFGVAYPKYQYAGAGHVQQAHNAYLQFFCELGVIGGTLFLLFWGYFLYWGGRRILQTKERESRLVLLGLYVGILAFLLHAFIDIHFSHSSLLFILFVLTAVFFARAQQSTLEKEGALTWMAKQEYQRIFLMGVLLLAGLAFGLGMRVFLQDMSISRVRFTRVEEEKPVEHRYKICEFFLTRVNPAHHENKGGSPKIPFRSAYTLIRDVDTLCEMGRLYAPNPGGKGARRLHKGDKIPVETSVLVVTDREKAFALGREITPKWLKQLAYLDSRFPHNPTLAVHMVQGYDLLVKNLSDPADAKIRLHYADEEVRWAQEAVRRSPMQASLWMNAGETLWTRGMLEPSSERFSFFEQALRCFEKAGNLSIMPHYLQRYVKALHRMTELCREFERPEEAAKYTPLLQIAEERFKETQSAYQEYQRRGLYRQGV